MLRILGPFAAAILWVSAAASARAYSVLTHEAIIDAAWKDNIRPLLLDRFPAATPEDLRKAHAYAYGGAIVQDMGYYPLGNVLFTDLAHYIRSGDFVLNLLSEAQSLNDYAFAIGSLAHYAADNIGHPEAINKSVPLIYPKLERKFGKVITYADDKASHLKVEFAFDVSEVAQAHYAPDAYHDFIGFEVAQAALERAFLRTYDLKLSSVLHEEMAIGTFRFSVHSVLPFMTKAAWDLKKDEIQKAEPSMTKRKFIYNLSRSSYRKRWGRSYREPGLGARIVAFFFRIIPKVGPLKAFAFRPAPPATQKLFMKSMNDALDQYRELLAEQRRGALKLPNENFDTGEPISPGRYRLVDSTYARWLEKLSGSQPSAEVRADILRFYSNPNAPDTTKRDEKAWRRVQSELETLKAEGSAGPEP